MTERKEYPRPQFQRDGWQSLNGEWEFAFDEEKDGEKRGLHGGRVALNGKINVPFAYQYAASGIGDTSQRDEVWYRREFVISEIGKGKRALLCFNAADYETDVWVNGRHVCSHVGGFTPFSADITDCLEERNVIVVRCKDELNVSAPRGKQSWIGRACGCHYLPTTGIWQSVWIEFFGSDCIENYSLIPNLDDYSFGGEIKTLYGRANGAEFVVKFNGEVIKRQRFSLDGKHTDYLVLLDERYDRDLSWGLETPRLIYVDIALYAGSEKVDEAHTRFGLRKISVDEQGRICLNDRPLYQRLVLDQGYWKDTGMTPPSAEALKRDVELAKAMGFNGARKHQKTEDPYFCYYAEELGFLTWCEMPSAYRFDTEEILSLEREWNGIVANARNCTSNICYVPFNESWGVKKALTDKKQQSLVRALYYQTKALDDSRLISSNDGFENVTPTDVVTIHDYAFDGSGFAEKYKKENYDKVYPQGWKLFAEGSYYGGQPVLFTEFGGIAMQTDGDGWGYNAGAKNAEEVYARLEGLMKGVYACAFQGYCYTQLTDVQQELNGLLDENHEPKLDVERVRKIFGTYNLL